MTYRSEQAALDAQIEQVEAELEETRASLRSVEPDVTLRRAALRWRRLTVLTALGLVLGVAAIGFAHAARRRAIASFQLDARTLDDEIARLEQRIDQLKRVRSIAESPLLDVLSSFGAADDPRLFEAIRDADPRKTEDAFWVAAHGACRVPRDEDLQNRILAKVLDSKRDPAQQFCSRPR